MTKKIRASVAMAAYNGEKYIAEQIDSIINMLSQNDEIIISYDISTDNTLAIIKDYEKKDDRIHVVFDSGHSVESNFNNAVANCHGEYIFLADQDDVWINDKINIMVKYFIDNPRTVVLIGDGYLTDSKLNKENELFKSYNTSANAFRNYIKGSYLGCQMAFRNTITTKIWPVNIHYKMPHDLWLGILGSFYGKVELISDKGILHRIHEENYSNTSKMKLFGVIKNRFLLINLLIIRLIKNIIYKK